MYVYIHYNNMLFEFISSKIKYTQHIRLCSTFFTYTCTCISLKRFSGSILLSSHVRKVIQVKQGRTGQARSYRSSKVIQVKQGRTGQAR